MKSYYIISVNSLISTFSRIESGRQIQFECNTQINSTLPLDIKVHDKVMTLVHGLEFDITYDFDVIAVENNKITLKKNFEISKSTEYNTEADGQFYKLNKNEYDTIRKKLFEDFFDTEIEQPVVKDLDVAKRLGRLKTYFLAMKTKPFVLLAGISGTGKSRIVKELAFATCPKSEDFRKDENSPGNYCMIEVKPNWHDSTELLGFGSNLTKSYKITPFVHFLIKALKYPKVPFFVCLDEMNLAPVEQYFAEFLSVLESRKIGNKGKYSSESLIKSDVFCQYGKQIYGDLIVRNESKPYNEIQKSTNEGSFPDWFENLRMKGLPLPHNLIVIGTVNMDDTTHQFSRKVIDRAMTIEMNNSVFSEMFEENDYLSYPEEYFDASYALPEYVSAKEFLNKKNDNDGFKEAVLDTMNSLEKCLNRTPFRVAFRVENELILYFNSLKFFNKNALFEDLYREAVDDILNMKVLPRIEGDATAVENSLKELKKLAENKNYTKSLKKIDELMDRLNMSGYTSYWP